MIHFLHYFYVPSTGPWYTGNVWGNVFVIAVVAPLGWLWSKTRFWPMRPLEHAIHHVHERLDEHASHHEAHAQAFDEIRASLADLHRKHDALSAPERKVHGPSTKGTA